MNLSARIIQTATTSAHQLKQQVQDAANLIDQRRHPQQQKCRRFSDGGSGSGASLRPNGPGSQLWRALIAHERRQATRSPESKEMSFPSAPAGRSSVSPSRHQASAGASALSPIAVVTATALPASAPATVDQALQPSSSSSACATATNEANSGPVASIAQSLQVQQHNQAQALDQQQSVSSQQTLLASQLLVATTPSPLSPVAHNNNPSSSVANPDTRTHVVGELYDTERSYVESLQILVEKYMKPLKSLESNRILIDLNLADEIFYTIPELLQHHETFLSALQDRLSSDWDTSQVIGNVFIEAFTNKQIIDTYTAFINNWKNAKHAIKVATQAKPAFERFLEAMSREHRNKLTLDALLIMPVQRIPRYELLIKELIKHTPEDHPDYGPLIEAQKQIHELALKIDRAEREMIHQEQLRDLESLIEGHAELQHPQRDFIRYDLVTILGASALTVAKKERVLFLFCDLLIMTSIKKKVSRRSNLQNAFANSSNDLSLLEGNKFKLLLRVSLDQVEIHLANDQIQLHQQQQEQHIHQLQLQQQNKLIQDRKREIETDLHILHQIESLSSQFSYADKSRINDSINELAGQLRQRLFSLEQNDPAQTIGGTQQLFQTQVTLDPSHANNQSSISASSASIIHSPSQSNSLSGHPSSINSSQQHQTLSLSSSLLPNTPLNSPLTNHHHHHHQHHHQDSNASLELIISNNSNNPTTKESPAANLSSYSTNTSDSATDQAYSIGSQALDSGQQSQHHHAQHSSNNSDILVVTFASVDRRQAFLQAFIEAKQQRYQLRQQQHRTFSSSLTVKLAQSPDRHSLGHDPRRSKLQHQDNIEGRYSGTTINLSPLHNNSKSLSQPHQQQQQPSAHQLANAATARISSAPLGQRYCQTIVHQMSAPQFLALVAASGSALDITIERNSSQCASCSSNNVLGSDVHQQPHHQHHHHQLIHQPASQPASLDTICCREQHNEEDDQAIKSINTTALNQLGQLDEFIDIGQGEQYHYQDHCPHRGRHLVNPNNNDVENSNLMGQTSGQHIDQALFFKFAPNFLASIPMNFLSTQHPALQFTCSTLRREQFNVRGDNGLIEQKRQSVKDNSGQLWLCMSNGYVSHIALISMRKKWLKKNTTTATATLEQKHGQPDYEDSHMSSNPSYQIVPVIQSAGDICKSHINCAAQVRWTKKMKISNELLRGSRNSKELHANKELCSGNDSKDDNNNDDPDSKSVEPETQQKTSIEVAIDAASPPADIKPKPDLTPEEVQVRLSESAPSCGVSNKSSVYEKLNRFTKSPASTSRLELPPHSRWAISQPRSLRSAGASSSPSQASSFDRKRSAHDAICHRHYHHDSRLLQNRFSLSAPNQQQAHQRHHFLNQQEQNPRHRNNLGHFEANDSCRSGYNHHHHHHHYNTHQHHVHHSYNARHNTVPLAELRRSLDRQNKVSNLDFQPTGHCRARHLAPPPADTSTDSTVISSSHGQVINSTAERSAAAIATACSHSSFETKKVIRASTPPLSYSGNKSLRSARLLRHQASLKTSSILAKLVGSASRRSSRKSGHNKQQRSDIDENDTDIENEKSQQNRGQNQQPNSSQADDNSSLDSNILTLTAPGASKCMLNLTFSDTYNPVVSPLSSVSSLNSTNSSIADNSICASSPNRSAIDLIFRSYPASCCNWSSHLASAQTSCNPINCAELASPCGFRSRSATVPSRKSLPLDDGQNANSSVIRGHSSNGQVESKQSCDDESKASPYKISELIGESADKESNSSYDEQEVGETGSSLWLGCDDGSLVIIDCLANDSESNNCNSFDPNRRNLNCGNVHSEIKLGAPVCDICTYKSEMVLVALANGQLAIFSRIGDDEKGNTDNIWTLTNPKILTVTANELNSTSKLCLVNGEYLWYSFGRNIFVLNVSTLKLETTIVAPTNDLSLQFTMQPVTIDNVELMAGLDGVWITFKNSHLIQLYDIKTYKLLIEVNLSEPINKMLHYGNEILRHHKTSCLKATSLLSVNNAQERRNTLFIGTSAGIVLYLNITLEQLERKEPNDKSSLANWTPQVACLRHGHSGQVRFLHLIEVEEDQDHETRPELEVDGNNNNNNDNSSNKNFTEEKEMFLISGGAGVDLYGPCDEQQQHNVQLNNDEDNLNHLLLWKLS